MLIFIVTAVGQGAGNFIFQEMRSTPDYSQAADRTFFQIVALATVYLALRLSGRLSA